MPGGHDQQRRTAEPCVEKVISEELPKLKEVFHKKVMANVSGFSTADYAYTCERLDGEEQVGWLEVNISCPNVHGGGMSFGTDPKDRKSTRLNSSHIATSRMPSSA